MSTKYDCVNPLTLVWNGLWEMAEANSTLTDLVRVDNRIKYDSPLGHKPDITEGDLPELQLLPAGAAIQLRSNSTSSKYTQRYVWGVTTGEFDINRFYNCVVWELYRAMFDWNTTLCGLVWPVGGTWKFVTNMQIMDLEEGKAMVDVNKGIAGWAAMLQLEIEMHFRISDVEIT